MNQLRVLTIGLLLGWSSYQDVLAAPLRFASTINSPAPRASGLFGIAANSFHGNALVGEPGANAVRMIDLASGAQVRQLNFPDPLANRITFGNSLVQAGDKIVVGDGQGNFGGKVRVGSAYVFNGLTGQHLFAIRSPVQEDFNYFAQSVEFAAGRLFINAEYSTSRAGKVYAFNPDTGQLLGTINNPEPIGLSYGFGADLEQHGNELFISAVGNQSAGIDSGAVYLYDAQIRTLKRKISDPRPMSGALFGFALDSDDSRLLVGAPNAERDGVSLVGEAYLFDASTGGLLQTFENPEPAFLATFGGSVALLGDLAVIGAPGTDLNPGGTGPKHVGAFYVFDANTGDCLAKFISPEPGQNLFFPGGLEAIGNRLVAMSESQPVNGLFNAGTIYVYDLVPEPGSALLVILALCVVTLGREGRTKRRSCGVAVAVSWFG